MVESSPNFTDQDLTIDDYRSFSPSSLFALVIAFIVSLVAAVNPSLKLVTVFGIGAAIFAIFRLVAAKGKTSGYVLSAIALVMPLFVFSYTFNYEQLRWLQLTNVATEHSETWLELLQEGRAAEAHELTLTRYEREPDGTDLTVSRGSIENPKTSLAAFLKNNLDRSIIEDGEQAKFVRRGGVAYMKEPKLPIENFFVTYEYERPNGETRKFRLQMRRQVYRGGSVVWNALPISLEPKETRIIE